MARFPQHPILGHPPLSDRSLGRLDMARQPRHPILTECSAFRPLSWSIGYGEATSPSHPDGLLRFPTALLVDWIWRGNLAIPSCGMLRKRPLFPLSQGRLQGANYLIINY